MSTRTVSGGVSAMRSRTTVDSGGSRSTVEQEAPPPPPKHRYTVNKPSDPEEVLTLVPPTLDEFLYLCRTATEILSKEPNVLDLDVPVSVVGDVGGQVHDILEVFRIIGPPSVSKYLFLGNYTGEGLFNIETLAFLLRCKVQWPDKVFLLRGVYETRLISQA